MIRTLLDITACFIPRRWEARAGLVAIVSTLGITSIAAFSALPPPNIKPVDLAAEPLYAAGGGGRAKPTLTLALSVEFPTVGAQYLRPNDSDSNRSYDDSYDPVKEYLGYFDVESCYRYNNNGTAGLRRFDRYGPAVAHGCAGQGFSGNFMNWSSSSAIDILRLGLTGGDRIVDTSTLTVLQRAVLSSGRFYNDNNFPAKRLSAALVTDAVPLNLFPAAPTAIFVANCLDRIYFGTQQTGSCGNAGNNGVLGSSLRSDPFFYARVSVCEAAPAGVPLYPRAGYCQRYPSGNYKPVGNMQKHSGSVRIAAFGYLADDQQSRYGGVLRAPMKFVGPKTYDADGALLSGTNPAIEWDESTGVFVVNPDNASEGKSGVINYLNMFGRTGSFGYYKTFDPIGELYYESLRYIQGLPPTPQATSGLNTALKDGFPVYTSWTDPHGSGDPSKSYTCLRNNILVIGDKNTHNDKSIPGNTTRLADFEFSRTASDAANEPDFTFWTSIVGGFEANVARAYIDGQGVSRTTSNPNSSSGNYSVRSGLSNISTADTGATKASYYMAGMAYWANTHDIRGVNWADSGKRRPGMRAKTYVLDVNEFGGSNDPNARRNSQLFLTAKYGGFSDVTTRGTPFSLSGPVDNSNWSKDAPDAGEAKTHFLASSASSVLQALDDIFNQIETDSNSIAGGAVSTSSLTPANSGYTYQARFDPSDWSGDVLSLAVGTDTAGVVTIADAASAQWSAKVQLNGTPAASRNIVVGRAAPSTVAIADAFLWANLETSLKAALSKPLPTASADAFGPQRVDFIRGDRSLEGSTFRRRGGVLGDIVNSAITFTGPPTEGIITPEYQAFYTANKARANTLYVGANDGMLHALNASTGNELFGYIPSWVAPRLSVLSNTTYNNSLHQSYVDGLITTREALIGSSLTSTTWKTVLVGATGGGGQGVFALDVTNPAAFDRSKVMWEFTDRDDVDMGNVLGKPQIMKFRVNAIAEPVGEFKYFAVFAGGVNSYVDDGNFSASGAPTLFILDLSKPYGTPWTLGTNYFKLAVPFDSTLGVSKAVAALNFNATAGAGGAVEAVYMGDLHGRLWKFDFSRATTGTGGTAGWTPTILSTYNTAANVPKPFFIAYDASGVEQPISMEPYLSSAPNGATVILFGTGKYLEADDNMVSSLTQVQTLYALWDPAVAFKADGTTSAIAGKARLQAGTASSGTVSVPAFTWGHATSNSDSTQRSGWYVDFPSQGERQISQFNNFGNTIVFASVVPPSAATNACGGGSGASYIVNVAVGNGTRYVSTQGVLSSPLIFQTAAPTVSLRDSAGQRSATVRARVVIQGSGGLEAGAALTDTYTVGRLSWRQLANYPELKAKAKAKAPSP